MNATRRRLCAALPGWVAWHAARAADNPDPWALLARGGVAILLRHAQTEPGIGDPAGFRLDDCRTQRNLSAAGRVQAQRIGRQLIARGVQIDRVLSSRWCRCVETARLALPDRAVQVFEPLNSFFDDRTDEPRQTAAVRAYLAGHAPPGNLLLVTHMVNIAALAGQGVAMGEAVLVRAQADGTLSVVGRLPAP